MAAILATKAPTSATRLPITAAHCLIPEYPLLATRAQAGTNGTGGGGGGSYGSSLEMGQEDFGFGDEADEGLSETGSFQIEGFRIKRTGIESVTSMKSSISSSDNETPAMIPRESKGEVRTGWSLFRCFSFNSTCLPSYCWHMYPGIS